MPGHTWEHKEYVTRIPSRPISSASRWDAQSSQLRTSFPVAASSTDRHLQEVVEDNGGAESKAAAVNGAHDGIDHMRGRLKDVGPHVVEQMGQGILTAQSCHSKRHVLHHRCRRLPMHLPPRSRPQSAKSTKRNLSDT